jgi:hypothetical protein
MYKTAFDERFGNTPDCKSVDELVHDTNIYCQNLYNKTVVTKLYKKSGEKIPTKLSINKIKLCSILSNNVSFAIIFVNYKNKYLFFLII